MSTSFLCLTFSEKLLLRSEEFLHRSISPNKLQKLFAFVWCWRSPNKRIRLHELEAKFPIDKKAILSSGASEFTRRETFSRRFGTKTNWKQFASLFFFSLMFITRRSSGTRRMFISFFFHLSGAALQSCELEFLILMNHIHFHLLHSSLSA